MNDNDSEIDSNETKGVPVSIKVILIIVFGAVFGFVVWQYLSYVNCPKDGKSPSDLGLPALFVFSSTGLFLLLVPLEKLGLRIKKIGSLEFEEVVATQAAEHAEDLSEIEERLNSLEINLRGVHEGLQITEAFHGPELHELVLKFLTKYSRWSFSPLRIRQWGGQKEGFEKLRDIDPAVLRSTLRKLVAEGLVETSVSKKGNTLYSIVE